MPFALSPEEQVGAAFTAQKLCGDGTLGVGTSPGWGCHIGLGTLSHHPSSHSISPSVLTRARKAPALWGRELRVQGPLLPWSDFLLQSIKCDKTLQASLSGSGGGGGGCDFLGVENSRP